MVYSTYKDGTSLKNLYNKCDNCKGSAMLLLIESEKESVKCYNKNFH